MYDFVGAPIGVCVCVCVLVICSVLICSNLSSLVWWRGSFLSDNTTGPCSPDSWFDCARVCVRGKVFVCVFSVKTGIAVPFSAVCSAN